jgi:hypothetical protein
VDSVDFAAIASDQSQKISRIFDVCLTIGPYSRVMMNDTTDPIVRARSGEKNHRNRRSDSIRILKCSFQNQNQNSAKFSDSSLTEAQFVSEGFVLSLRQSCLGAPVGGTMSRPPFELESLHRLKSPTSLTLLN